MTEQHHIQSQLIDTLVRAQRVFVFTGAGASKESGLPTFRDTDGEWSQHDPMTFATFEGFSREPLAVWNMYRMRQSQIADAQPNLAHITLAKMERYYSDLLVVTQNVDDLHERAGSRNVVKLHGDAWQMRCLQTCGAFDVRDFDLPGQFTPDTLPKCPRCGAMCRPNIVWFGEYVPQDAMLAAVNAAAGCDLMIIVGTSGEVSNGYGFAEYALANGAKVIEINPSEGALTHYAHYWIPEPAGEALPRMWRMVTGQD